MKPIYYWIIGLIVVTVFIVSLRGCERDPFASGELAITRVDWGAFADSSDANMPYVYVSKNEDGTFNMITLIPYSADMKVVYKASDYDAGAHHFAARFDESSEPGAPAGVYAYVITDVPADVIKVVAQVAGGHDGTDVMTAEGDDEGITPLPMDALALHTVRSTGATGMFEISGFIYMHDSYSWTVGLPTMSDEHEREVKVALGASGGTPDQVAFFRTTMPIAPIPSTERYRVRLYYLPRSVPGRSYCFSH